MEKKQINLNETKLCKMIGESIKKVLNEYWDEEGDWVGGPEDAEEEKQTMHSFNKNRGHYKHYRNYKNY